MKNFFRDKFEEVYRIENIRQVPFTPDELKEVLPCQEDQTEYLRLFKELYEEALLFHCQPTLGLVKQNTYPNDIRKKYKNLLEFCFFKNLFDYDVFSELGGNKKDWDHHFMPMGHLTVKAFRYYEYRSAHTVEALDEYRLRIEEYFAQLDNWYLDLRYNVSECFKEENGEYILGLYKFDENESSLIKCTFDEIEAIYKRINNDLKKCEAAMNEMAMQLPDEFGVDFFEKYYKWFERRKRLDYEYAKLEECLCTVKNRLEDFDEYYIDKDEPVPEFGRNRVLYIYFGDLRCHKHKHTIIQSTAIVCGHNGQDIELNVEYCRDCDKFLLRYQSFEEYRKRYKIIIGNFREVYNGQFYGGDDLALESPLKLSGYTVSQKEGLSHTERHYILATIIHNGIMTKGDVIRYLNYFIMMQGAKKGNEIALQKWKYDLMFVQEYNKSIQPRVYINEIKKF